MKTRALIGLSTAAMSALVAAAVGCGQPAANTYTPSSSESGSSAAASSAKTASTSSSAKATSTAADKAASAKAESATAASAKADTAASAKAEVSSTASASYTDGTYEASAQGKAGDVPVTVTVSGGKITDVTVGDNSETEGIGTKAIEQLPSEIVEANGTDGVDGVSGATLTSNAILTAVSDALAQAGGSAATSASATSATSDATASATAETSTAAAAGSYADGTYEASGKGIGGDVPVTVTISGGKITDVTVGDNDETEGVGSKAIEHHLQRRERNPRRGLDRLLRDDFRHHGRFVQG